MQTVSLSQELPRITFFRGSYRSDHPAASRPSIEDPRCIGLVTCLGSTFAVFLNPDDARGFNTTTRLLARADEPMERTFNREYSPAERTAYHRVQALVENAYERLGLVPQHLALSNEALLKAPNADSLQLGNRNVPLTLSCLTIGRGIPGRSYVQGVPLLAPPMGTIFDERGLGGATGQGTEYQSRTPWNAAELGEDAMTQVSHALRAALQDVIRQCGPSLGIAAEIGSHSVQLPQPTPYSYYTGTYAKDHWCFESKELSAQDVVGIISCHGCRFSIYPIPPDCRGYRTVVRLAPQDPGADISTTYNRDFTLQERIAFHEALGVVEQMYYRMGLFPQQHILANMAHGADAASGRIHLGHDKEPLMLHAHTVGRGIPNVEYIKGMPLIAPPPGHIFDIGGKGGWESQRDGNTAVPWSKVQSQFSGHDGQKWQGAMLLAMKATLGSLAAEYNKLALSIHV
jgi:hypothetical protein